MPAGGCRAVAQEIPRFHLLQIGDGAAKTVGSDAALFGIALALDIPELKHVEEIAESHAVEIVRIETFLNVPQLHRTNKDFESVAAAITATRTVGISFGHHH